MEKQNITLTISQQQILKKIQDFVYRSSDRVFILKGYAGTGKTTMMKFLIDDLIKQKKQFKLLSTTGRAAKILANYTNHRTSTIHGVIYKFKSFNADLSDADEKTTTLDETGQLFLIFEPVTIERDNSNGIIYIVDEASMISDTEEKNPIQAKFGSGRLLKELLNFDTLSESKYIFVGDPCQLPPINGVSSPALSSQYFKERFSLKAQEGTLTEIMRQDNSIIAVGSSIRKMWEKAPEDASVYHSKMWGTPLKFSIYKDVVIHPDMESMMADYLTHIKEKGYNDAIFISDNNRKCYDASIEIRNALGFSGDIQKGDLLMVVQNQLTTGLMNGDMVEVLSISQNRERTVPKIYNKQGYVGELYFREIKVKELFTQREYDTLLLENTITGRQNNLDSRQQSRLFLDFILRMKKMGITQKDNKKQFDSAMQKDPYLNALRCSYGYVITCHKAQGGEWNTVYVQIPRNTTLNPTKDKYQWLYTAFTRAKDKIHIVQDFFVA